MHSFWISIWNYLTDFEYVLNIAEVQKAITSLNQSKRHPFWAKCNEALRTLVTIPKEKGSVRKLFTGNSPTKSTKKFLEHTIIHISPELQNEFAHEQFATLDMANYVRFHYDADDLNVLRKITKLFPGFTETIFGSKDGNLARCSVFSLSRVEQFVEEADRDPDSPENAICEPNSDNVFIIAGRQGPLIVSVRKKLNHWRMRRIGPTDTFRYSNAFVFIC